VIDAVATPFDYDTGWDAWDDMKRHGPMSLHTRRLIWNLVRDLEFASVLDVGCGQGSPLEQIAERRPGVELTGVDISAQAVHLAQRRLPNATLTVLDLTERALDRQFDLVICSDVLEHIPDDRAALRNIRKMTRRWCLVSTLQGRMRAFETSVGHVRNYRRGEVRQIMEEEGFVVRRQLEWGFPFYSPIYRDILDRSPASATTGEYGLTRKVLSRLLYYLFCLNLSRVGDYVFCLAEAL
jgi:SAM-dependent methyltransferase